MSYLYTLRGAASRLIRPAPAAAARTAPGTCARTTRVAALRFPTAAESRRISGYTDTR